MVGLGQWLTIVAFLFSLKFGLDKGIDITVHNALDVIRFFTSAMIICHLIGLEDVGADLATPADVTFFAVFTLGLGFLLVFFYLVKSCFEDLQGDFPVTEL